MVKHIIPDIQQSKLRVCALFKLTNLIFKKSNKESINFVIHIAEIVEDGEDFVCQVEVRGIISKRVQTHSREASINHI